MGGSLRAAQGQIWCKERVVNNERRKRREPVKDRVSQPSARFRREVTSPQDRRHTIAAQGAVEMVCGGLVAGAGMPALGQYQQRRRKALGDVQRRNKREWSALYERQQRQREQLAEDCRRPRVPAPQPCRSPLAASIVRRHRTMPSAPIRPWHNCAWARRLLSRGGSSDSRSAARGAGAGIRLDRNPLRVALYVP